MIPLDLENDSLDLEKLFNENKYPAMRIVYEGDSIRSKALRSMRIFEKLAFSAEKYDDIRIQIEVKKGESEIMTVIVSAVVGGILHEFGEDIYKFMKKKILEQTKKSFESEIKVETNEAWEDAGLRSINSDKIYEKNDKKDRKLLHA